MDRIITLQGMGQNMGFSLHTEEDIVGIDIRDSCIVATQLRLGGGRPRLRRVGWVEYELDATDADLSAAIKRLWRTFGFSNFTVCSALPPDALTLKQFRYPSLNRAEIESALRLEAEEALQLPQDELLIDCHVNGVTRGRNGSGSEPAVEGILIAAPRQAVTRQVGILRDAGLYPVVMDVACMALGNLFHTLKTDRLGDVACLVNLSVHSADIVVLGADGSIHPRTVLSRASMWKDATDFLLTTIQDSLKYHQFKLRRRPVDHLVFTGHVPSKDQVMARVSNDIRLPVEFWTPISEFAPDSKALRGILEGRDDVAPLLSASLGLALRR